MRRPTRAQLTHRRVLALGVLLLAGLGLAWTAVVSSDPSPEGRATSRPTPAGATTDPAPSAPSTTTAPPTTAAPTTTTTPTGRFVPAPAPATGPVVGEGTVRTYRVEVEDGSGIDAGRFGDRVEEILSDPRGWTTADGISLQRVAGEAELVVTLATPATTDRLCFPLDTAGEQSCAVVGRAIINLDRWLTGAAPTGLTLADYRRYVVTHELGHTLGHGHVECPAPGTPAPVMMQQTISIGDCAPNPWPVPTEVATG
ncbi:DUF3152 domain-containing protein [Iamia sp.]|uniref:DUF3152 domain-containing protein n=1 Tax=Iamia sp. TaxID=2722710 RepID=UPI002C3E4B1B|nr:DUF3152 domain-containing protein [Iamia sp.]HXH57190.1 DUF3152 domain-containing protein [Iamia sp.]